jgi:hypothetical protein
MAQRQGRVITASNTKSFSTSSTHIAPTVAPPLSHKSSPGSVPNVGYGHHSSITGITSRRTRITLGPVPYDKNDSVSLRKAKNVASARKSRARVWERMENLEVRWLRLT